MHKRLQRREIFAVISPLLQVFGECIAQRTRWYAISHCEYTGGIPFALKSRIFMNPPGHLVTDGMSQVSFHGKCHQLLAEYLILMRHSNAALNWIYGLKCSVSSISQHDVSLNYSFKTN
ncbi:hypothetical protein CDAR_504981 [Caerostris darwini]|uniref:Uncharacterized protein n=1 Tax=Caerostris darwini TaxID=1538125 RepID=A0AAV4MPF5_9ARAC|nr:hypothetical protein CDAR_504981 [Caerostris darwini]